MVSVAETLQHLSHDIRSAMSDVIGGLRLIDRARLAPEARAQVDRVQSAGDTLAALVDAALTAASGDTLIQDDDTAFALSDWLTALSGRWSGRAQERDRRFIVTVEEGLPPALGVSQVALDRIVGNLISNAFHHAGQADVALRIGYDRDRGLSITVTDGGPGFSDEVLLRARSGDGATAMGAQAGSGLGLRIAAELSRQLGGELTLANHDDGGGAATLRLPESCLSWDRADMAPAQPPDLSGLRVLVAEDNLTNQTILRQLLDTMTADATFVTDGAAALEMLERRRFDIALVDIEMPRVSGLEVMRAVRARAQGDALSVMPLVALTAYVLRDNREAIYAAGADGIIGKPISSAPEFGRMLLRYAGRAAGLPEPEDILRNGNGDPGLGPKMDHDRLAALIDVAGPVGRDELIARLHEDLSVVRDALDAAVAVADIAEIRAQTHILIALSGAVGAERLRRLSEVLNIAAKRRRTDDFGPLYQPCRADLADLLHLVAERAAAFDVDLAAG